MYREKRRASKGSRLEGGSVKAGEGGSEGRNGVEEKGRKEGMQQGEKVANRKRRQEDKEKPIEGTVLLVLFSVVASNEDLHIYIIIGLRVRIIPSEWWRVSRLIRVESNPVD